MFRTPHVFLCFSFNTGLKSVQLPHFQMPQTLVTIIWLPTILPSIVLVTTSFVWIFPQLTNFLTPSERVESKLFSHKVMSNYAYHHPYHSHPLKYEDGVAWFCDGTFEPAGCLGGVDSTNPRLGGTHIYSDF